MRTESMCLRAGKIFEGKAAIITAPLGCLKAGNIRFQPALPQWKQDAVSKLGFGALNKACDKFLQACGRSLPCFAASNAVDL